MMVTITLEHQLRARAADACQVPRVGTPLHRLTQDQLAWTEGAKILTPTEIRALWQATANEAGVPITLLWGTPPLTDLARYGFSGDYTSAGNGAGLGYGDGYGDGASMGDGNGYGDGDGYGHGYGDGDGYGDGPDGGGFGAGDGYGYGGYGYSYGSGGAGDGYGPWLRLRRWRRANYTGERGHIGRANHTGEQGQYRRNTGPQ